MAHNALTRVLALATTIAAAGLTHAAWACAACALRQNDPGRQLLSVGMIVLPFTVVGASVFAIRRMARDENMDDGSVAEVSGGEGRK